MRFLKKRHEVVKQILMLTLLLLQPMTHHHITSHHNNITSAEPPQHVGDFVEWGVTYSMCSGHTTFVIMQPLFRVNSSVLAPIFSLDHLHCAITEQKMCFPFCSFLNLCGWDTFPNGLQKHFTTMRWNIFSSAWVVWFWPKSFFSSVLGTSAWPVLSFFSKYSSYKNNCGHHIWFTTLKWSLDKTPHVFAILICLRVQEGISTSYITKLL